MKSFGEIIRKARQKKGLKVFELANKIGVNPVYITQIEKHNKFPSIAVVRRISDILEPDRKNLSSVIGKAYVRDKTIAMHGSFENFLHKLKFRLSEEYVERFEELKKYDKTLTHKKVFMAGVEAAYKEKKAKEAKP